MSETGRGVLFYVESESLERVSCENLGTKPKIHMKSQTNCMIRLCWSFSGVFSCLHWSYGFREKDHRRNHFPHILSRVYTINMIYEYSYWPWSPAWNTRCSTVNFLVSFPSLMYSLEGSTVRKPPLNKRRGMLPLL